MSKNTIKKYYEKVYIIGTGKFAFQCAKLVQNHCPVECVYEYRSYVQSNLKEMCMKDGISYMQILAPNIADRIMEKIIKQKEKILIISASNMYIFPEWICKDENVDIINYHPGLLNKHLGRNAEAWAIWAGDVETGITWHEVNPEIDKGKIYVEKRVMLDKNISSLKLMIIQYKKGLEGLKEIISKLLLHEKIKYNEVSTYGKMHYSKERPNNGILEENWDEEKISAFLRSMDYGMLEVLGKPYIIDNNKRYEWHRYQILKKTEECKYNSADRVIEKENYFFILENYYEKEE